MTTSEYRWVAAAALLSILAVILANELRAGGREARETRERVVSLRATAERLERSPVSVPAPVADETDEVAQAPTSSAVRKQVPYPDEIEIGNPKERDRARAIALAKMHAEPESRALLLAEGRESLRSMYPGLAEQLHISPDEEDRLLEMLAERQLQYHEKREDGESIDYSDFQTHQQILDTETLAQLGEAKFKAFERYRETRMEREEVRKFRDTLDAADDLSAAAAERLVDTFAQETARIQAEAQQKQQQHRESFFGMGFAGGSVTIDPTRGESALADAREQLEEQDRRIEKVAEPILTAQQRTAFKSFLRERRDTYMAYVEESVRDQLAIARQD